MTVRAKMRLTSMTEVKWSPTADPSRRVRLETQYDSSIPEDQAFTKATPSGHIEMTIDNPAALAQLELGKAYYVDFTPTDG